MTPTWLHVTFVHPMWHLHGACHLAHRPSAYWALQFNESDSITTFLSCQSPSPSEYIYSTTHKPIQQVHSDDIHNWPQPTTLHDTWLCHFLPHGETHGTRIASRTSPSRFQITMTRDAITTQYVNPPRGLTWCTHHHRELSLSIHVMTPIHYALVG